MRAPTARRRLHRLVAATAASAAAVATVTTLSTVALGAPGAGQQHRNLARHLAGNYLFDTKPGLTDLDARRGRVAPTAAQLTSVRRLGATARWNRFGTPESLIHYGGWLGAARGATPAQIARAWLSAHAALFRLTPTAVQHLDEINDSRLPDTPTHVVLFRQQFGKLAAAQDGLITVAVRKGRIGYVSSSSAGMQQAPAATSNLIGPAAAWVKAAANVGRAGISLSALSKRKVDPRTGWTTFTAPGFAQLQRARLVAVPMPGGQARAAYETIVLNVAGGAALAYTVFVDAHTGQILMRYDRSAQDVQSNTFSGAFTPEACGPLHDISLADNKTQSIQVVASATILTNDIVLYLKDANGNVLASSDTATSPEAINYAPSGGIPQGVYHVQVCPFQNPTVPDQAPYTYTGAYNTSDTGSPSTYPYPPSWRYFTASPPLNYSSTDTRINGCWVRKNAGGTCNRVEQNPASRAPWDFAVEPNVPTFTTLGNNASTAESWFSPLTPGPTGQRAAAADRKYNFQWTDQWNNSKCDPTSFSPSNNRNDIDASVTNLFVGHNRFHDFAYHLGFTEDTYNAQVSNFGNTAPGPYPAGREDDPELGDVQAGAVDGGAPTYEGRDNANQITLNDGIPPITNQYLFQPIAGAFYAACTDGDFDTSVFGHEYTHLISNRMVGGPDDGLVGAQAGAMGESWSDQDALEYLHEYGYVPVDGENDWAEGPYVTGNPTRGIRNYALNHNPLNYSDVGYDTTGPEVHADGEIWNAVGYDLRQAFVRKYNHAFPASNAALQRRCAQGVLPADKCPGNRRWIQMVYDAFLLQQSGTSMLDARDAYLAADQMRFGGADQKLIWHVFATRGMGTGAATNGTDDDQPTPSFRSPLDNNATFVLRASDMTRASQPAVKGTLYVGRYEARVTPIADTDPSTPLPNRFQMAPGKYHFVFQANGYGMRRLNQKMRPGRVVTRTVHLAPNLASRYNGATATGSVGSINTDSLIDDTESTNWAALSQGAQGNGTGVNATHPSVTIKLAGTGPQMVRSVQVSALLRPANASDNDPEPGARFTALRQFRVDACIAAASNGNCTTGGFHTIYTSPKDAFPAGLPRPLAPDELLRTFNVPDTMATHLRLVVLQNQCTGTPAYQGEQDNDPTNSTDCDAASSYGTEVRAAEFEAYSYDSVTRPPGDPVVLTTMKAPTTATPGSRITYKITYQNLGPHASSGARIADALPAGLRFVSASVPGRVLKGTRTVVWRLGSVPAGRTGTVRLTTKVTASAGQVLVNQATFTGAETVATPAAALTTVTP